MAKHVTLTDVARKSKVSVSTVSLVLRAKPGIPDETRARVLAAAEAIGYPSRKTNGMRRAAPTRKLSSIGLILRAEHDTPPQANPFYSYVIAGIEQECRRNQVNLMYAALPVDNENVPVETPRLLEEDEVDGLLLVGAYVGQALGTLLRAKQVPIVLVDAYAAQDEYDAVLTDNARAAHQAVSYLIECGHRHIALVGAHPNAYPSFEQRRAAYRQAMHDHSLDTCYFADAPLQRNELMRATQQLLEQHPQITAVFGVNDEAALAALNAAQAMGKRVPDELSVVGFDDIDLAQNVMPSLTTMHVDKLGMGRLSVQLLMDRLLHPEAHNVVAFVRPRLMERESVSKLPEAYEQASSSHSLARPQT